MSNIDKIFAGSLIYNIIKSDKNEKKANEKNLKSLHSLGEAKLKNERQEKETRDALTKLARRKRALMITSVKDFVELYSKIGKIKYMDTNVEKDMQIIEQNEISTISQNISIAATVDILSPKQEAFYVLGGIVGVSRLMVKETEQALASAKIIQKESSVLSSQYESIALSNKVIYERVIRITDILTRINILLIKSNKICNEIIENNGYDFRAYSKYEKDCITTYVMTAKTLKQIIDAPVFNNGELTKESEELLQLGEDYIRQIQAISSN